MLAYKKNQKDKIKDELKKLTSNSCNVNDITKKYNVSVVYANSALRELVNEGEYVKFGRGNSAIWKRSNK